MKNRYDKQFKEEEVRLSDEIGVKRCAEQLGIPYYTLTEWRGKRTRHGKDAFVGSGLSYSSADGGMTPRELVQSHFILQLTPTWDMGQTY